MLSRWKRAQPAPLPFNPHATPPAGSAGDAFDEHLRLPRRPLPGEAEEWQLQQDRRLQRRLDRTRAIVTAPRMHPAVSGAIACLAVGLVSWGPLRPYGAGVAAFGAVLAAFAIYRVKVSGAYATGARRAAAAGALCLAWALATQAVPERLDAVMAQARRKLGVPAVAGTPLDHAEVAANMDRFALLAACAVKTLGESAAITTGLRDRDGRTPSDERYAAVPTLNASATPVRAIFRDGNPNLRSLREAPAEDIGDPFRGLEDPYSEGGRFPHPVVVRDGHVIVWSQGPDRDADLSPMHDIRPADVQSYGFLIDHRYDPTNGAYSSGDLILWKRLDEVDCTLRR